MTGVDGKTLEPSAKMVEAPAAVEAAMIEATPKTVKPSAAQRLQRTALVHRVVRFAIQIVFFIFSPALFSGAFNGIKYLFTQIGVAAPIELTSFLALLIAVLAFTIVFGRFFCGYACAFGTLGDALFAASAFLRSKTPIAQIEFPLPLVRFLSLGKYVVLASICAACYFGVWSAYSGYSPWIAFAGILSGSVEGIDAAAFIGLGAIVIGMLVRERFFCQFLCPLGAVFSLMPVLGFSEFTRTRAHCARKCNRCQQACPVDIWPDADKLEHGECISCGRCADACPLANVNMAAFEKTASKSARSDKAGASDNPDGQAVKPRPLRKTPAGWVLFKGSEIGAVLVKAALLLLLCWCVGALRYVPPFGDVVGQFALAF